MLDDVSETEKHEPFLSGLNEDILSIIESDIKVDDIVQSTTTGTIYIRLRDIVSGYKWDGQKKTFTHQFTCKPTGADIHSLVVAPPQTTDTDQLYISVGYGEETKQVYRLGGKRMKETVLLTDTSYIDDKCWCWTLGSDPQKQILLIHPRETAVIYIQVEEQRHAQVNLNEIQIGRGRKVTKIALIGQNVMLGMYDIDKLCMFGLVVTQDGASIKSNTKWGPVETKKGRFAALCHPITEAEQLHLFTADHKWFNECTVLREYKVGVFAESDVTSANRKQLDASSQPTQSLTVKGKRLIPHCVIRDPSSRPVLIAETLEKKMSAMELGEKLKSNR